MDYITDAMEMVEHLKSPAFCVREGIITNVNSAAASRMIDPGTPISDFLKTGIEEYRDFAEGCLYLTLNICGQTLGFSVTRKHGFDLFQLEQDTADLELQALALAARELREPLASIMISTEQLIPNAASETNPAAAAQVARINRGLFQMLRLISNMSDANRYATDNSVSMEVKNIPALLEEVFSKAASLVSHSGIRLEYTGIAEPVYGLVNSEMLERAVLNILSNALKFTPQDGHIQATLQQKNNKLYLSILDNGIGIQQSLRSSIFSRYTREAALEDGRFGIGLGFVMIRSAAARHGGTVLVDHPQETGTRITMTLAIRPGSGKEVRSPILKVDYAGERDHGLVELSDVLSSDLYDPRIHH